MCWFLHILLRVKLEGRDSGVRAEVASPALYLAQMLEIDFLIVIYDTDLEGKWILAINL